MLAAPYPFPTLAKLEAECGATWTAYAKCVENTEAAEAALKHFIQEEAKNLGLGARVLDADSSLVLFGSFARHEMLGGSDCDWTLLIDGPAKNSHAATARMIESAIRAADGKGLKKPGSSGVFGNLCFSHDLVHKIGGLEDSNTNLTRRILMLLESRPVSLSAAGRSDLIWSNVLRCILERYFEEEAHFNPRGSNKVPRFLLNDLTRYWRTIGVDYASKYRDQGGQKWALRNAKLRLSRKLLAASGMAFCFSCELDPPDLKGGGFFEDNSAYPFIQAAAKFAGTPPLEVLAQFIDACVGAREKRETVSNRIFGAYNAWLELLDTPAKRQQLEDVSHEAANSDPVFQEVREISKEFAAGLRLLFFNCDKNDDRIAHLSHKYVGF